MSEVELIREFGENLKYELDDAWMTQKELSEETGISEATISKYINGSVMPTFKNVLNIAYALNCSIYDLVTEGEKII